MAKFDKLSDILTLIARRHAPLAKRLGEAQAVSRWEAAVGPQIAKHARAVRVEDGVLWVEVDHAIWKAELQARKNQILAKLKPPASAKGESPIRDLFWIEPRRGYPKY